MLSGLNIEPPASVEATAKLGWVCDEHGVIEEFYASHGANHGEQNDHVQWNYINGLVEILFSLPLLVSFRSRVSTAAAHPSFAVAALCFLVKFHLLGLMSF
ncbi:hypothetical protein RND81_08G059400 [Saponaria officinalis]|uniref:Uncharacterized protein n=1 Tax=Saponaria officinalis TaxID=3572 RepID=A0AAW1J4W6_SAPOF